MTGLGGSWIETSECNVQGQLPILDILVSTSALGLIVRRGERWFRSECPIWTYGLAKSDAGWIVGEQDEHTGSLTLVHLPVPDGAAVQRLESVCVATGLPRGLHQMDRIGLDIVATDTYNNRLLVYGLRRLEPGQRLDLRLEISPTGYLTNGRSSHNYMHYNSIFGTAGAVYLVAHNDVKRTGKASQLVVLDAECEVLAAPPLAGVNCHNVYVDAQGNFTYLASSAGTVYQAGVPVFSRPGLFLRGLARSHACWVVGASKFDRSAFGRGHSYLFFLSSEWELMGEATIPGTQLHDLRLTSDRDWCQSECDLTLSQQMRSA